MSAATAAGKVILAGEHAVVYGVPALAVGIERGASATSYPNGQSRSKLLLPSFQMTVETGEDSELARAFGNLLDEARRHFSVPEVDVEARATLPPGGGLGCSAALGVAIARALVKGDAAVAACAMAWERVFHGNPSGIDAAVSMRGGCLRFVKGQPPEQVHVGAKMLFAIGFTGSSSSTKAMVDHVARLRARDRVRVDEAFERIRAIVEQAVLSVGHGQLGELGALLSDNQRVLASLDLSTPTIDKLCHVAIDEGALGSKLTGAGGGGSVIALCSNSKTVERVLASWSSVGTVGFATEVAERTSHPSSASLEVQG